MAYTVQKGDTLSKLYGSNWKALSGYTGDPTKLQIGTQLPDLPTQGGTTPTGSSLNLGDNLGDSDFDKSQAGSLLPAIIPTTENNVSNINDSTGATSANEQLLADFKTQMADISQQLKDAQTKAESDKSLWSSILNKPAPTNDELIAQQKQLQEALYPNMAADVAEVKTLQDEYNKKKAEKAQLLLNVENRPMSMALVIGEQAAIEKKYNNELNEMATNINSKNANIAAMKGNMNESIKFIEDAKKSATEDTRFAYQQYMDFTQANQATIKNLSQEYQQYLFKGLDTAKALYDDKVAETNEVGEYMVEYNKYGAGITMSDTLAQAQVKAARVNPLPKSATTTSNDVVISPDITDPIANAVVNAFNIAVLGLPGLAQQQAQKTFANYINNGQVDEAKKYLLGVVTQGLPTDQQNQAIGRGMATSALIQIDNLLAQAKEKGVDTNILTGNLENAAQKLGASTNSDLAYIGSLLQQQFITYRRAMTGVAFSPQESSDYKKIFPDITNVEKLNTTKIKGLVDTFDINNRAALSTYLGGYYDEIFGTAPNLQLPSDTGGDNSGGASDITPEQKAELDKLANGDTKITSSPSFWSKAWNWITGK